MAEKKLSINAIPVDTFVELLKKSGSKLASADSVHRDFESGAPKNDNDTVNLLDYAAWLIRRTNEDGQ